MTKSLLRGCAFGIVLLLLLDALAARLGLVAGAMPRAAGPMWWTTSRALGVTGFVALSLDVAFGLFLSTGAADRWVARARSIEVHRWLSSVTLLLVASHALLLLGDSFVRFDALDVLVPFVSRYRSFAVGLGVLAAYLAALVHLSFGLRARLGAQTWRRLHYLSFAVYLGGLLHGVLAGSDTRLPLMRSVYVASGAVVGLLIAFRSVRSLVPARLRSKLSAPARGRPLDEPHRQ